MSEGQPAATELSEVEAVQIARTIVAEGRRRGWQTFWAMAIVTPIFWVAFMEFFGPSGGGRHWVGLAVGGAVFGVLYASFMWWFQFRPMFRRLADLASVESLQPVEVLDKKKRRVQVSVPGGGVGIVSVPGRKTEMLGICVGQQVWMYPPATQRDVTTIIGKREDRTPVCLGPVKAKWPDGYWVKSSRTSSPSQ